MTTPLISRLKDKGTFITFGSSAEDVSYTFQNSSKRMQFSNFVLIDIPNIESPVANLNTIDFDAIESVFIDGKSSVTPAVQGDSFDLAQSIQNYLLNLETLLVSESDYNPDTNLNVSEKVFFKWLIEIGAIRFADAPITSKSTVASDVFTEELETSAYSSIVKYVGEIDIEGAHRDSSNAYKELYMLIPTNHGATPSVLFKSTLDQNFKSRIIRGADEFIEGRDASDNPTTAGLSVLAHYDVDVPIGGLTYTVDGVTVHPYASILTPSDTNLYVISSVVNDPTNSVITKDDGTKNTSKLRSNLNGVTIDFEKSDYKFFEDNPNASSFVEFNNSSGSRDFDFNAVLIYYDVFDINDPDVITKNLYGVLFLDDLEAVSSGGSSITSLSKIQPSAVIKKQGNSYGIRLNMKFDATSDNVEQSVEISVNDYNTFSMLLFSEALEQMRGFREILESETATRLGLINRISELEQSVLNSTTSQEFEQRIANLEGVESSITTTDQLADLVTHLTDRLDNIALGNEDSIPVTYRFNIIPRGNMSIERNNGNVYLESSNNPYDSIVQQVFRFDVDQAISILNLITNLPNGLVYQPDDGQPITVQDTIYLYIDDSIVSWEINKSLEIKIDKQLILNGNGLAIYTDALDVNGNGQYGTVVKAIAESELSNRPHIKIVCVSVNPLSFITMVL